jgi:hypothetical protein
MHAHDWRGLAIKRPLVERCRFVLVWALAIANGNRGRNMTQVIIGMAAGILLGLRWKCFVLFPISFVIFVMMISIGGVNWAGG